MDCTKIVEECNNKVFWSEPQKLIKIASLLNNDFMSDITFVVKQKRFPAHKFVLAIESEVFHAMFYGPMADDKNEIKIKDCENPNDFLEFLSLIYNKKARVTWENIEQLSYLRKKYMITVDEAVFCSLLQSINDSDLLHMLQKCVALEEDGMIEKCMEVIREQISELVNTLQFLALDQPSLKRILQQEVLDIEEIDLLKAVDKWCIHQVNSREANEERITKREAIGDAFYLIRFPILKMNDFIMYCRECTLLTDKEYRELSSVVWSTDGADQSADGISLATKFPASKRKRQKQSPQSATGFSFKATNVRR